MFDKILINEKENCCVIYYVDGRMVTLRSSNDISIKRFLEWFMSNEYYTLVSDEQWERSQEKTQEIKIAA